MDFQQQSALVERLDSPRLLTLEWGTVHSAAYMIHQRFHYRYPGQISQLKQRLMVIPPEKHGDQRLVSYKLEVSSPTTDVRREVDQFGNLVLSISADSVARMIDFTVWLVVERTGMDAAIVLPAYFASEDLFDNPSALTQPGDVLQRAGAQLLMSGGSGIELARAINRWVYRTMTYSPGATDIRTTAEEALQAGRGVCQDYSHIMIALCRLCGIPARYVSGHLLGEGATHAWVEVILDDPDFPGRKRAFPFDPTHGVEPGINYVTVAVGRDYADVAPTSGTFIAPFAGELTAGKRAGMVFIDHLPGDVL